MNGRQPLHDDARTEQPTSRLLRVLAIGAALVVNLLILLTGRLVTGDLPIVPVRGEDRTLTIGYEQVAAVTLLFGLAGWGLLVLVEQVTPRAGPVWLAIAVVVFALSLHEPLDRAPNTEWKVILAAMHVGAAVTIIPLMWRSTGRRR